MSTKELSVFMYSTCPSRELDHFLGWAASWSGTVHTYGWNSVRKLCCFAAHVFHSARHSKAFNVKMIALKPNFDCATLIVIHLCATYPRHFIFAAEVKAMEICATLIKV